MIKYQIQFPTSTYLDFYSGEENYLLQKGKDFVLAIYCGYEYKTHNRYYQCENYLFEYDIYHEFLHINLVKRFVVIDLTYDIKITDQFDAIEKIKNTNTKYNRYMIVDMKSITPFFLKYRMISENQESIYKVYTLKDFA